MLRSNSKPSCLSMLALAVVLLFPATTYASAPLTDANITNAIVGEASDCPYVVKRGIASAIRNRKTLKGVYGFNARHIWHEPQRVWVDARRACRESHKADTVRGARYFGSARDVAKGTFFGLSFVCVLGNSNHLVYFFK